MKKNFIYLKPNRTGGSLSSIYFFVDERNLPSNIKVNSVYIPKPVHIFLLVSSNLRKKIQHPYATQIKYVSDRFG